MSRVKKIQVGSFVFILIILILLSGRIYLPFWLKDYVNHQIAALNGYGGSVEDIDVHLWRGAYQIHGLNIYKEQGGLQEPFVAAETIDLSLEWSALLKGAVVAEIDIFNADLNFSRNQTGEGANWSWLVDKLSPLEINRLDVHSGKIAFIDYSAQPDVNIFIHKINAQVKNLRQITDKSNPLPSPAYVSGASVGDGEMFIEGRVNILKEIPDFDLEAKLENAKLLAFNDYTRSFVGVDFESGSVGVYAELAAADGRLTGYVKPVATNISVIDVDSNPLNTIWESMVSVFMELFENQSRDQFAMRIPIEGNLNDPDRNMWSSFLSIFQNAFGQAFTRDTDGDISFNDALLDH